MTERLVFEDPRTGRRLELGRHTDVELAGEIIQAVTSSLAASLMDVRAHDGAIVADFRVSVRSLLEQAFDRAHRVQAVSRMLGQQLTSLLVEVRRNSDDRDRLIAESRSRLARARASLQGLHESLQPLPGH